MVQTSAAARTRGNSGSVCGPTRRRALAAGALTLLAMGAATSCDGPPSGLDGGSTGLALEVVAGADQRGLPGQHLQAPIWLRVTDGKGGGVEGVPVTLSRVDGGGQIEPIGGASTNTRGHLGFHWRLGSEPSATHRVRAAIQSPEGGEEAVEIGAGVMDPSEADQVRVFGASAFPVHLVSVSSAAPVRVLAIADSIFPTILPPGHDEYVVFSDHHPPALVRAPAGPGPGTLTVTFQEPLSVPLRIVVASGSFDERRAVVEEHVAATERVLSGSRTGLVLGPVEIVDGTGGAVPASYGRIPCSGEPDQFRPGAPIEVRYVEFVAGLAGVACLEDGFIAMAEPGDRFPYMLAHEIGHMFSLWHVTEPSNVMLQQNPGPLLTAGQVFRVHFHERSLVSRMYGLWPDSLTRPCLAATLPGAPECLAEEFTLP